MGVPNTPEPLVSVIVPTRNSEQFLGRCLLSIRDQTYRNIEIVVVDNFSIDGTISVAEHYADTIIQAGPERSAQVNMGVRHSKGTYVYRVDSDFVLQSTVISECVELASHGFGAIVVHNSPDTSFGWLSKVRKFETDMYKYSLDHSAARFLDRDIFLKIGGYREDITAGEDYDLQIRLNEAKVVTGFITPEAIHLGEPRSMFEVIAKNFMYGKDFTKYVRYNKDVSNVQLAFLRKEFVVHWMSFVLQPWLALNFIVYYLLKFIAGGFGFILSKLTQALSSWSS